MIKKLSAFIFAFIALLSFPLLAFASDFTVSNVTYNDSTKELIFDISGLGGTSVDFTSGTAYLCLGNVPYSANYGCAPTATTPACSNSHCDVTLTSNFDLTYTPGNTYLINLNNGTSYSSQNFILPEPTPTPTPAVQIIADPSSSTATVGTPFNVDVKVTDAGAVFNAAQATVTLSSNLSITGISYPTTSSCNFNYTQRPTTSDPSFAGAIFGSSSTGCTAYTLTLTPNTTGSGTITFTNGKIKAYSDSSEILTGVQNGSFTISAAATPTPTAGVPQLTVTSPLLTYLTSYTLAGGKDAAITHVFINTSETGVTFPTSTTWQAPETLSLGDNNFTIYGSDGTSSTATQTVNVSRHTLGDINGDGVVDLTDASLFAVDFGKTSGLTYILSDMNGDGSVDLTDYSILAKLE